MSPESADETNSQEAMHTVNEQESSHEIIDVLMLRLLIARAAGKDSLAWWEDESLAEHSTYLLDRIFPVDSRLAARSLALHAALARHQAAYMHEPQALHLFRLDAQNRDKLAVRQTPLTTVPLPKEPIRTMEELKAELVRLTNAPKPYQRVHQIGNQAVLINIPPTPPGVSDWQHRAQTLAWAYLEGAPNQPAFPYFVER